jgi:hypothetical protein
MLPSNLQITFVWKNSSHISTTNKRENQTPKTNQLAKSWKMGFFNIMVWITEKTQNHTFNLQIDGGANTT